MNTCQFSRRGGELERGGGRRCLLPAHRPLVGFLRTGGGSETKTRISSFASRIEPHSTGTQYPGSSEYEWNHLPALFPEKNKNVTLNRESAGAKGTNGAAEALQKQNEHRLHQKKTSKNIFWRRIRNIASGREEYWSEEGPDRIEVYPFERGCEALWSRSAARVTRVERLARALAGPAGDLFAELLAASHLLLTLPVDVVLKIARCSLAAGRAALCGAVAALADEALKPALALGYNALARPPLVLAAQLAAAAREALRPLWLALADAAEPLARVLAAVRLVHVETRCACAHRV
ncbi:unnamed protein product [Colias eurytheme]|nr:unnamed protein product [Colias eurytheme]